MHADRLNARNGEDGSRKFAFFGTPIGRVVHFGCDRKAIDLIQQFIALNGLLRQPRLGK